MMPRKKRRTIKIITLVLLIIIIAVVVVLLYTNTDMFKSNAILFAKYLGQNIENAEVIYEQIGESEYNELLEKNKYKTETQIKVNYTQNIGTSLENTQNSINQLKIEISGQNDKEEQYDYQNINLIKNKENIAQIDYIQSESTCAIKFFDVYDKYILVENGNLKELLEKVGYEEEKIANVADKIEINNDWKEIFDFSKEEKQAIEEKYVSIINSNVSKEKISAQKGQTIQIDGKNIEANAYILTLTKEQLNNIYIRILEEAKQDEIILTRLDKMQELLEKYQISEETTLRKQFVKKLEEMIEDIAKNNIGQDETKIIVYENNKKTIRTSIQSQDYEITIDMLSEKTENYLQVLYKNITSGKEQEKAFIYKRKEQETNISVKNNENGETKQYILQASEKVNGNDCDRESIITYEDGSNKVEASIVQNINIVTNFEKDILLDEQNSVNLNLLKEDEAKGLAEDIKEALSKRLNEIKENEIKVEDLEEVLEVIGLVEEQQTFEVIGVTETEKNRFNLKFEILQGENLDGEAILRIIDAIKENLIDMNILSNTELELELDRFDSNEKIATTISTFIENNKDKKYNAKIKYDEETGLANSIIITIVG